MAAVPFQRGGRSYEKRPAYGRARVLQSRSSPVARAGNRLSPTALGLAGCSGCPRLCAGMVDATDVLILTTHHGAGTLEEFTTHPPAGDPPVDLGRGLTVEQLPFEKAEEIMDGCEPGGMDPPATRQFGQRNALVRRRVPQLEQLGWDPDATIATALALSRYVLPNAHGVEYAARLIGNGEHRRLIPLGWEARFQAYLPDPSQRDWLDQEEAKSLRDLLAVFWRVRDEMPERVVRAIWLCEYGSRLRYIDVAWVNTVTALEALLNTGRSRLPTAVNSRTRQGHGVGSLKS